MRTLNGRVSPLLARCLLAVAAVVVSAVTAAAQCPEEPELPNHTGSLQVPCWCFLAGEQAGAVFDPPSDDFPVEVTRVRIGWRSQGGGAPPSTETALHLYAGGLPDPGAPQFSLPAPVLTDGPINEFDLTLHPGDRFFASGPITVALEFLNTNDGDVLAPSVVHDGNGCTVGRNVVFSLPGGWSDACSGIAGDWVLELVYRKAPKVTSWNGSGVNFMTLTAPGGPPILGVPWTVRLDCSPIGPSLGHLIAYKRAAPAPHPTNWGEWLLDHFSPPLFFNSGTQLAEITDFTNMPPPDLRFCGFEFAVQGSCLGFVGPRFSNLLEIRAGL